MRERERKIQDLLHHLKVSILWRLNLKYKSSMEVLLSVPWCTACRALWVAYEYKATVNKVCDCRPCNILHSIQHNSIHPCSILHSIQHTSFHSNTTLSNSVFCTITSLTWVIDNKTHLSVHNIFKLTKTYTTYDTLY